MEIRVIRARKIFSNGKHNAFTGIAAFQNRAFIVFRSATNHVSRDGTVQVIASEDLETWTPVAEKAYSERDLRDPKAVAFRDSLWVYCGGSRADKSICAMAFSSEDGHTFSEPMDLNGIPEGRWLWAVQPCGDALYGTGYCERDGEQSVLLYRSEDGLNWSHVVDFPTPGNEVSIDFDAQGTLWALAREDRQGHIPTLCTAEPPYDTWQTVTRLPLRLQGPMVKRLEGGCVIAARRWDPPGRRNLRTDLFWLEDGQDPRLVRSLPSGGDTSYAGWLDTGEGRAVLSYYSSHEHKMDEPHSQDAHFSRDRAHAEHTTPADIFLADVSYAPSP